jgi:hypothetical protein
LSPAWFTLASVGFPEPNREESSVAALQTFVINAPDFTEIEITWEKRVARLRAEELDALIAQLGELRSRLNPAIPSDQSKVTHAHPIDDFYFRHLGPEDGAVPVQHGALLLFLSKRFGWFQLPADPGLCAALGKWLLTGNAEGAAGGAPGQ